MLKSWDSEPAPVPANRALSMGKVFKSLAHAPLHAAGGSMTDRAAEPAFASKTVTGRRAHNEDALCVSLDLLSADAPAPQLGDTPPHTACAQQQQRSDRPHHLPLFHFAGVFDGHGGQAVSLHCASHMAPILRQQLLQRAAVLPLQHHVEPQQDVSEHSQQAGGVGTESASASQGCQQPAQAIDDAQVSEALVRSFALCDECIPADSASEGGSTAVCALLGERSIWVANCGDSRALIARRGRAVISLSTDHKPERPDEAARIQAAGGLVFWNAGHRVMGVLNMSRAMGDVYLKQYGVIAVPEVMVMPRHAEDEFLLLASDGLWSCLSNQEAVALAQECIDRAHKRGADRSAALRIAAQVLIKAALQHGSSDNISVVLLDMRLPDAPVSHTGDPGTAMDGVTLSSSPARSSDSSGDVNALSSPGAGVNDTPGVSPHAPGHGTPHIPGGQGEACTLTEQCTVAFPGPSGSPLHMEAVQVSQLSLSSPSLGPANTPMGSDGMHVDSQHVDPSPIAQAPSPPRLPVVCTGLGLAEQPTACEVPKRVVDVPAPSLAVAQALGRSHSSCTVHAEPVMGLKQLSVLTQVRSVSMPRDGGASAHSWRSGPVSTETGPASHGGSKRGFSEPLDDRGSSRWSTLRESGNASPTKRSRMHPDHASHFALPARVPSAPPGTARPSLVVLLPSSHGSSGCPSPDSAPASGGLSRLAPRSSLDCSVEKLVVAVPDTP